MKKVLILFVVIVCLVALVGCGNTVHYTTESTNGSGATDDEVAAMTDVSLYEQSIEGIEECLVDRELLTVEIVEAKTEMKSEIIGASQGYRYLLSNNAFVELYEYDEENELLQEVKRQIAESEKGTFSILGLDPLTGVFSKDSKFLLVYNATIKYDYQPIADVVKEFGV